VASARSPGAALRIHCRNWRTIMTQPNSTKTT